MVLSYFMTAAAGSARNTIDFDADWRFTPGDPAGAEGAAFDDSSWRVLSVPHDWAFEADYAEDATQADMGGYKPGGIGWYRAGENICYYQNSMKRKGGGSYYTLSFELSFKNDDDEIYLAHCYPYTYSDCCELL